MYKSNQKVSGGMGLMDAIVGALVVLILGSVLLHVVRLGFAMYRLNNASSAIAQELSEAKLIAVKGNKMVSVIFNPESNQFGIDRNGNGTLERAEAEEMPEGVTLAEGSVISFLPSGQPPPKSKKPSITISNNRGSRNISVSSMGSIEIE